MSIDALFRQANSLHLAGDFAGAERRYRALTKLKPLWAYHNLGVIYSKLGRNEEAEIALRKALESEPASAATRHTLGMVLLRMGRYHEGWPFYEARRKNLDVELTRPDLPYPEWRGEDLAGRHLVVVREQGFGDQIQFARFLPRLAAAAGKVTFVCSPNLVRLFGGLGVDLVPASEAPPPAAADFWTPDCSLGLKLDVTLDGLPGQPYLASAPLSSGGGLGVVTAGSPTHKNDRNRSLPKPATAQLLALGRDLSPGATGAKDFQDTAEIIATLDGVISVDTSVAHLAAAMGKPTWILIPAIDSDWRWLTARSDSPWYDAARLYRQATPGKWGEVIARVTEDLKAF
jgi:hypothetical protein